MKKRLLIKISGAAIKGNNGDIYSNNKLLNICKQLKVLNKNNSIGIVLGGGNIWRGNMTTNGIFRRAYADYMGMMSTIMNAVAFKEVLNKLNIESEIYSALVIEKIVKPIIINSIEKDIKKNKIIIFAGGTGHPYFTTDTACAIRAIDIHADCILMGKDGVDGIYTDDPKKNKNAKFIKNITFKEAINKKIKIMDMSALTLCDENNIEIYVFDLLANNAIVKITKKQIKYTYVHK